MKSSRGLQFHSKSRCLPPLWIRFTTTFTNNRIASKKVPDFYAKAFFRFHHRFSRVCIYFFNVFILLTAYSEHFDKDSRNLSCYCLLLAHEKKNPIQIQKSESLLFALFALPKKHRLICEKDKESHIIFESFQYFKFKMNNGFRPAGWLFF